MPFWLFLSFSYSRWTRVNLNSNRTDPLYWASWRAASTGPTLSCRLGLNFFLYPAYHIHMPILLAYFNVDWVYFDRNTNYCLIFTAKVASSNWKIVDHNLSLTVVFLFHCCIASTIFSKIKFLIKFNFQIFDRSGFPRWHIF